MAKHTIGRPRIRGVRLLASALTLAAVFGLAACDDHDSRTGGSTTTINSPTGTVVGQLLDTNGNPIKGAEVFVAGMNPVLTNAGGQFRLRGVNVVAAIENGIGSGVVTGVVNGPISVQFVPPTDGTTQYTQATAQVFPAAQVVSSDNSDGGQTNPQSIFIDGFTADVGIVKIPALTTKVTGTLVDTTTGGPVGDADVALDFVGTVTDNGIDSVAVQYSYNLVNTTTAGDGSFAFMGVPDDSCFFLVSPGLQVVSSTNLNDTDGCAPPADRDEGLLVSTQNESANSVVLGDVRSTSSAFGDTTAPYVTRVAQVVSQSAAPAGALNSGADGTGGLVISFSEPLPGTAATLGSSTVLVTQTPTGSSQQSVPATASYANGQLTVTTAAPLAPGATVTVSLLADQFTDAANNALSTEPGGTINPPGVGYDSVSGRYLELALSVYAPPVTGVQAVTALVQNSAATNADGSQGACANSVTLFASSNAFIDTVADGNGINCVITQLNSEVLNTGTLSVTGQSVQRHLSDLRDALLGTTSGPVSLPPVSGDILTQVANISFTTSGAVDYVIVLRDGNNQPVSLAANNLEILAVGGAPKPTITGVTALGAPYSNSTADGVVVEPQAVDSTTTVNFAIGPVQPGYTIAVVPRGTGGVVSSDVSSAAMVALVDDARPTVGVQIIAKALAAASAASGGSGGGPIVSVTTAGGKAIFPVTPLAYDRTPTPTPFYGSGTGEDLNGPNEPGGLSNNKLKTVTVALPSNTIYDATGWAAFVPTNNLGVAVTEPLSTTATQPAAGYAGTASLGFVNTLNNVFSPVAPGSNDNNLYVLSVDNLDTLQADGRGNNQDIDLTGIVDASGLAADSGSNAKAQVRDVTPPFMTQAFRSDDGQKLVFSFNEPVTPIGSVFFLDCAAVPVNVQTAFSSANTGANAATQSADGKTLTIPVNNTGVPVGFNNTCFTTATYAEPAYSSGTTMVNHGQVTWSVPDTADNSDINLGNTGTGTNSWPYWTTMHAPSLGVPTPVFAAADLLGPFLVAAGLNPPVCNGFSAGATNFSCAVRVNQPIFFGKLGGGTPEFNGLNADTDTNGALSQTEVDAYCGMVFTQADSADVAITPPTSCNPLNAVGAVVTATGTGTLAGQFTASDVATIQGLQVNFTATTVTAADRFEFVQTGGPATAGGKFTLSSAPYAASGFAVTNYGAAGITSTGVVVSDDGVNPQSGFELLPASAP